MNSICFALNIVWPYIDQLDQTYIGHTFYFETLFTLLSVYACIRPHSTVWFDFQSVILLSSLNFFMQIK